VAWDIDATEPRGSFAADAERAGTTLGLLDPLNVAVAAHAQASGAVLVIRTRDSGALPD
jgi:hypothetical protein